MSNNRYQLKVPGSGMQNKIVGLTKAWEEEKKGKQEEGKRKKDLKGGKKRTEPPSSAVDTPLRPLIRHQFDTDSEQKQGEPFPNTSVANFMRDSASNSSQRAENNRSIQKQQQFKDQQRSQQDRLEKQRQELRRKREEEDKRREEEEEERRKAERRKQEKTREKEEKKLEAERKRQAVQDKKMQNKKQKANRTKNGRADANSTKQRQGRQSRKNKIQQHQKQHESDEDSDFSSSNEDGSGSEEEEVERTMEDGKRLWEDIEVDLEELIQQAVEDQKATFQPRIFRKSALKNFFAHNLAKINPKLQVQSTTLDYYSEVFLTYIFEKACFAYWKVKNNHQDFEGWPEALKMDHFLETAWTANYDNELTFLHR